MRSYPPAGHAHGLRRDHAGNLVPRRINNRVTCSFNGKPVFACELEPAISANPYLQFSAKVTESGAFRFAWTDDDGTILAAEAQIAVTA